MSNTVDIKVKNSVSAVILAHNILLADPKIDSEKIGISGISCIHLSGF